MAVDTASLEEVKGQLVGALQGTDRGIFGVPVRSQPPLPPPSGGHLSPINASKHHLRCRLSAARVCRSDGQAAGD